MRGELQRLGFGPFTDWEFMSSGMHALLAALRQCDAVDVYGFTSTSLHSSRHNYDGPDKPTPVKSDTFHSWDGERMILRLLHAAGAINICST